MVEVYKRYYFCKFVIAKTQVTAWAERGLRMEEGWKRGGDFFSLGLWEMVICRNKWKRYKLSTVNTTHLEVANNLAEHEDVLEIMHYHQARSAEGDQTEQSNIIKSAQYKTKQKVPVGFESIIQEDDKQQYFVLLLWLSYLHIDIWGYIMQSHSCSDTEDLVLEL